MSKEQQIRQLIDSVQIKYVFEGQKESYDLSEPVTILGHFLIKLEAILNSAQEDKDRDGDATTRRKVVYCGGDHCSRLWNLPCDDPKHPKADDEIPTTQEDGKTEREKIEAALKADFHKLYQPKYTTDYEAQRLVRDTEIEIMDLDAIQELLTEARIEELERLVEIKDRSKIIARIIARILGLL